MDHATVLETLGFTDAELSGGTLSVVSPIDGAQVAKIAETPASDMESVIAKAQAAFKSAMPEMHRGVTKGVLHKKTVARKLSRLSARVSSL